MPCCVPRRDFDESRQLVKQSKVLAVLFPHSFSVRLEPDDACWIAAPAAVMAVQQSNFHAPCCEACGKEWVKTVPTAESDPFVTVLTELHVHGATLDLVYETPPH